MSMSLIVPQRFVFDSQVNSEAGDKSPSLRSSHYRLLLIENILNHHHLIVSSRLQAGPSIDIPTDLSDDENDFDDNASARENYRFAPRIIRTRHSRQNS